MVLDLGLDLDYTYRSLLFVVSELHQVAGLPLSSVVVVLLYCYLV